jgi:SAM-dependent methyltransferase
VQEDESDASDSNEAKDEPLKESEDLVKLPVLGMNPTDGVAPTEVDDSPPAVSNQVSPKATATGRDKRIDTDEALSDDDSDGLVEVDSDGDGEFLERRGIAHDGPIRILEVGCGDVPIGGALASEFYQLQKNTGSKASSIVSQIICTDFSEAVVCQLKSQYVKESKTHDNTFKKAPTVVVGDIQLEFAIADARKLDYEDASFDLIVEKGTLDAMMSNSREGQANCVKIVSECARLLTTGGCFVIISHINAHFPPGIEWLEEVVFAGLNQVVGSEFRFEMEVHGNDELPEDCVLDEAIPPGATGPAVYVIHKLAFNKWPASDVDAVNSRIPVKFYSY